MSLYETLLVLHVLLAFALVAGLVAYAVIAFSSAGPAARGALAMPALVLWNAGAIGVLVFGIWLALEVDGYAISDGWILAAIALWLIALGAGGPLSKAVRGATGASEARRARLLVVVMSVATVLLLADMIWKPGA